MHDWMLFRALCVCVFFLHVNSLFSDSACIICHQSSGCRAPLWRALSCGANRTASTTTTTTSSNVPSFPSRFRSSEQKPSADNNSVHEMTKRRFRPACAARGAPSLIAIYSLFAFRFISLHQSRMFPFYDGPNDKLTNVSCVLIRQCRKLN